MVTSIDFDHEAILREWDYQEEQVKADFLEILYDYYQPADHTYTGLWLRFTEDCANIFRGLVVKDPTAIAIFLHGKL